MGFIIVLPVLGAWVVCTPYFQERRSPSVTIFPLSHKIRILNRPNVAGDWLAFRKIREIRPLSGNSNYSVAK
jgi:hypothetical protein